VIFDTFPIIYYIMISSQTYISGLVCNVTEICGRLSVTFHVYIQNNKSVMSDIKQFLYAWCGKLKKTPQYEFRNSGPKHRQRFMCEVIRIYND